MIIVDTNVLAYLVIPGDNLPLAEAALLKDRDWAAPALWRSELRNALSLYVRTGKFSVAAAFQAMADAEATIAGRSYEVESLRVLELAELSGCTAYDCEFISIAEQLSMPLVTADKKVLAAFPSIALSLPEFIAS